MKLSNFKALTFDCYGTLIDWESGMIEALEPLTSQVTTAMSRDDILQAHARHESSQQLFTPAKNYRDLLAVVYKRLAEEWHVATSWQDCVTYGESVKHWPAFPDSAESLAYLNQHFKLAILSNVDNRSFAASNEKLQVTFDAIYTAEDVGSYKPKGSNFDYMLEKIADIGVQANEILHTAESLFHDHSPANRYGLTSCWIYRRHEKAGFGATMNPGKTPDYQFRFNSMAEMVDAHRAENS